MNQTAPKADVFIPARSRRCLLMMSTALGCAVALAPQGMAAPIVYGPKAGPVTIGSAASPVSAEGDGNDAAITGISTDNNVNIYSDRVTNTGEQGIFGAAPQGIVAIDSRTVTLEGDSTAIVVDTAQGISIRSGTINATGTEAAGIRAIAASRTSIDDDDISGLNNGAIFITSDSINAGTDAIGAAGHGAITIDTRSITTTEDDALSLYVHSGAGDVAITSGTIKMAGDDAFGIAVTHQEEFDEALPEAMTAGTGVLSIASGSIEAAGAGSTGIVAQHSGDITIRSGTVSVGSGGDGILAETAIYDEDANGDDFLVSDRGGSIDIASTSLTAQGGDGITARSGTGSIAIDNGTVTIADVNGDRAATTAIKATSASGAISIRSQNISISSPTNDDAETDLGAIRAFSESGNVTVDSGSILSAADGRSGIYVDTGGDATITSASITTSGARAHGIHIDPETRAGAITIDTGAITTTGADAAAVHVSNSASTAIDITGALSSTNAHGVAVALLGNGANTVTQHSGGTVNGLVYADGGINAVHLEGEANALNSRQVMAAFEGFQNLAVDRGYWLAKDEISNFDSASVAAGATIELREVHLPDGYYSPVEVARVVNNGTIIFNNASDVPTDRSSFDNVNITGTGDVRWVGSGTYRVDSNGAAHTGTTYIDNGRIILTGTLVSDVVTSDNGIFQLGNGGASGEFQQDLVNNGTFIYARRDDYDFGGDLSGSGSLIKQGAGVLTLSGNYSYTGTTTVEAGALRLRTTLNEASDLEVSGGTLDLGGTHQNIASLSMTSGSTVIASGASLTVGQLSGTGGTIDISNGTLNVDQNSATHSFAGRITGNGEFTKSGIGDLKLESDSDYSGPTTVRGGRLSVNASIASPVTVASGAIIGGSGRIGTLGVRSGGFVAPGNSIGTLSVNGNVTLATGSIYEVEVNADGHSDKIVATGQAHISGAQLFVSPQAGSYALNTSYTVLEAAAGVDGEFAGAGVANDFAFLTPTLNYGGNSVTLLLRNNGLAFTSIAATTNQKAVAGALTAAGSGSILYNSFASSLLSTAEARAAFDSMSGEVHAAIPTALVDENRQLRRAFLNRELTADLLGPAIWGQVIGSWAQSDGPAGIQKLTSNRTGLLTGIEIGGNGLRIGAAFGYADTDISMVAANGDVKSKSTGVYGGWANDRMSAKLGGTYSWHDIDTRRQAKFPAAPSTIEADYGGHSAQFFGEFAYKLIDGPVSLSPVAGLAWSRTHTDEITESGGATALSVASRSRELTFTTLGLKAGGEAPISSTTRFLPTLSVLWQHGWGNQAGLAAARFAGTGTPFTVEGAHVGRNGVLIDGGFDVAFGNNVRLGVSYSGAVSNRWADHGVRAGLTFSF